MHWLDRGWEDRAIASFAALDDLDKARMSRDDKGNTAELLHDIAWNRGDITEVGAQLRLMDELVEAAPSAQLRWNHLVHHSRRAFFEGRLAEALEWNDRQLEYGNQTNRPDALNFFVMLDGSVARDDGRPEAMIETVLAVLADLAPEIAAFASAHLATWLVDAGRDDEAREIIRNQRAAGFRHARLPVSTKTTYAYALSDAVVHLRDRDAAAELFEIVLPWSGCMFYDAMQVYGAVDRSVGRLATLLGRFDDADRYLAAAAAMHEEAGAPLFLARTRADQATLLLARGDAGDRATARALVDQAVSVARDLEAPGVERYALTVLER